MMSRFSIFLARSFSLSVSRSLFLFSVSSMDGYCIIYQYIISRMQPTCWLLGQTNRCFEPNQLASSTKEEKTTTTFKYYTKWRMTLNAMDSFIIFWQNMTIPANAFASVINFSDSNSILLWFSNNWISLRCCFFRTKNSFWFGTFFVLFCIDNNFNAVFYDRQKKNDIKTATLSLTQNLQGSEHTKYRLIISSNKRKCLRRYMNALR